MNLYNYALYIEIYLESVSGRDTVLTRYKNK